MDSAEQGGLLVQKGQVPGQWDMQGPTHPCVPSLVILPDSQDASRDCQELGSSLFEGRRSVFRETFRLH